ncbi:glycosyltransferase family 4 protein [Motilimonas cestriensis]|uniref:Glycosyltransferase family 4 protein n=1 Tax=Motilimonas cestriensis TaxID=2742685 RepID=A0ABS8W6Y3_9GAMM|nr:glycosyltransferase family 4 protein [Motilimonas cestriensis]
MLTITLVFIISLVLTGLMRQYALHKNIIDDPNHRSSHQTPTPRGGGIAVVASIIGSLIWLCFTQQLPVVYFFALSLPLLAVAAIGFLDDLGHVAAKWRLVVHLGSTCTFLILLPNLPVLNIANIILPSWLLAPLLAIALVWFINLYNFMDGIDGFASLQGVTVLSSACLLLFLNHDVANIVWLGLLIPCILGFLAWNWPPARIFMGDACSGGLGLLISMMAVLTSVTSTLNLWVWLILMGYFVSDASYTLVRRILDKQQWTAPHRSHLYQILSRRWHSHLRVTLCLAGINLVWFLPLAWLAMDNPTWGLFITLVAYIPVFLLAWRYKAGLNND